MRNLDEARRRLTASPLFDNKETEQAVRIIKSLISKKYIAKAQDSEAESRIDYLADILGMSKREVISAVERMRQEGILADSKDLSALPCSEREIRSASRSSCSSASSSSNATYSTASRRRGLASPANS